MNDWPEDSGEGAQSSIFASSSASPEIPQPDYFSQPTQPHQTPRHQHQHQHQHHQQHQHQHQPQHQPQQPQHQHQEISQQQMPYYAVPIPMSGVQAYYPQHQMVMSPGHQPLMYIPDQHGGYTMAYPSIPSNVGHHQDPSMPPQGGPPS
ncbi:hypothetical protein HGRIS_005046 [Hohenbuehelia grisea]|uniref:Uncharacterized protein n=1 Tax=Hohenbuehelia grisea TaxID=104357 RepID=A0ABR3JE96_9AGAR